MSKSEVLRAMHTADNHGHACMNELYLYIPELQVPYILVSFVGDTGRKGHKDILTGILYSHGGVYICPWMDGPLNSLYTVHWAWIHLLRSIS